MQAGLNFWIVVVGAVLGALAVTLGSEQSEEEADYDLGSCVGPTFSASMIFESEYFDLETSSIYEMDDPWELPPGADFVWSFNADADNPIRLFAVFPASIAFLESAPFEKVNCDDLATLAFTQELVDLPLDPDDSIILHTAEGNLFKIGNAHEREDFVVSFEFAELRPGCSGD